MTRIIVVGVLLIGAFLGGFVPAFSKGKRLENELREARLEISLAQLRDLAGLAYLQASQKDYGLAAGTSALLFDRTREVADKTTDLSRRKSLEDVLSLRDKITAGLAKGDPGVLSDLQALFVKTRLATALPPGASRPD